jgi:hypothetical protein
MVDTAAQIWRDYTVDGVTTSGIHKPPKANIRKWATAVEGLSGVAAIKALDAGVLPTLYRIDTADHWDWNPANLSAQVASDPTNTNYIAPNSAPTGASGAWVRKKIEITNRAELAASVIASTVNSLFVKGHTTEGIGGAYYKRVTVSDGFTVISADGAIWRLNEPITNLQMFGAIGNGDFCDAARNLMSAHGNDDFDLLEGDYKFATQWIVDRPVVVRAPKRFQKPRVRLFFENVSPASVDATYRGAISLLHLVGADPKSQWCAWEGIGVFITGTKPPNFDGWWIATNVKLDTLHQEGATRDGFRFEASLLTSNTDHSVVTYCSNGGDYGFSLNGFHTVTGSDSSAILFSKCADFGATNIGFLDESFLGNTYDSCDAGYAGVTAFKSVYGAGVNLSTYLNCYVEGASSGPSWDIASPGLIFGAKGTLPISTVVGQNSYIGTSGLAGFFVNDNLNGAKTDPLAYSLGDASNSAWRLSLVNGYEHHWFGNNITSGYAGYGISRAGVLVINLQGTVPLFPVGLKLPSSTVATLPSAATVGAGTMLFVTDALSPTYNGIVAGGGTVKIKVVSDGVNWRT